MHREPFRLAAKRCESRGQALILASVSDGVCCRCSSRRSRRRADASALVVCPLPADMLAHADSEGSDFSTHSPYERLDDLSVESPPQTMPRKTYLLWSSRRT